MESVHPLPSVDVRLDINGTSDIPREASVTVNNTPVVGRSCNGFVDQMLFADEKVADRATMQRCLSPLLSCMKIFGCYFDHIEATGNDNRSQRRTAWRKIRAYCILILVLLWFNAARSISIFNRNEKFGSRLLLKLIWLTISFFCAILHTGYFIGCESGTLSKVLNESLLNCEAVPYFRKFFTRWTS
jgi:hypothetical protein